jgi:tetratricopeptide (TPR) repeat protein
MEKELTHTESNTRLRRELSRDAIALALKGDWERAAQVNRGILELFSDDVDAMNRLGKALLELGQYQEAEATLHKAIGIAPYNNIAKKNLARLHHLENAPAPNKQVRKPGGAPQLFIEESGKSATTVLQKPAAGPVVARIAPGDPVSLRVEKNVITVKTREDEYLGRIEPKMGTRLIRLMNGGNQYEAAIISVSDQGTWLTGPITPDSRHSRSLPVISVIIRETFRHPNLQGICSFPTKSKEDRLAYLGDSLLRYIEEDDLEDEDERESHEETDADDEEVDSEEWK